MKNTIPLIVAILLGSLAVWAVSRLIKPSDADAEKKYVDVVAAARDITPKDDDIKDSWLMKRTVEISSVPAKAIPWTQANRVVRQKAMRTISRGDYILMSDISGMDVHLSGLVAEGEWAVPVTFSDPALVRFLQPGDEIAILGAYVLKEDEDGIGGVGTIIVSLNPQQAATLVAAQREMELYPALRHSNDPSVRRRRDVGLVNDKTFQDLKTGLEVVTLPDSGVSGK